MLISSPSSARVFTICGATCAATGKSFGGAGEITRGSPPADGSTAIDAGRATPKERTARYRPLASGTGDVSIVSPLVSWRGAALPSVGTAQMCRRSTSFAFVQ